MLFTLCACDNDDAAKNDDEDDVRGSVTTTPTQGSTPDNNQNTTEPEFSLGQTSGSTYTNEFLGLEFVAPAGWTFYTDEQILQMNNIASGYYDEKTKEQLKNASIVYDMLATQPSTNNTVNVNLQKLLPIQLANLNIKKELESQISVVRTSLQNMGMTDITIEYQKVTVDGKEYDALVVFAKANNVPMYEVCFAFRKSNYLASVTVCSIRTDTTASLLDCFTIK